VTASDAPPLSSGASPGGRAFLLGVGALVVARACLTAHAPSLVDAHVCLAALALALVAGAPKHALAAAGLVVGGALLSVPTSWDSWISLLALPAALGPAAFFVLGSTGTARRAILAGIGIGGAVNALAAIVQRTITWPDQLRNADKLGLDAATVHLLEAARPLGLSLSPDLCGGLCIAGAFAAFALAIDFVDDARNARVALIALAAVSASGVFVVRSFGTALAAVAGMFVCAVLFAARRSPRQAALLGAGGIVIGVVAVTAAVLARGSDAIFLSASERVENWKAALAIAVDHPVLGVGFMRFPAAYLAMRSPDANLTLYAHSTPLQYFAEGGVVGVACVVAAFVIGARVLWRRRQELSLGDIVLAGGAIALAARMAIDYDGHVAQTASITGALWGVVLATEKPRPADSLQQRVIGLFTILALLLTGVLAWRDSAFDRDDKEAPAAVASYSRAFPFDVEARLKLARIALTQLDVCTDNDGCPDAIKAAHAALDDVADRAHPPGVALVMLARVLVHEGKLDAALNAVDRALAVDPGNEYAHQVGVSIDRSEARVAAAQRWHVAIPDQ
jgi:O-antigen ligase